LRFLWYQKKESEGIPLEKWKAIENPKDMGGWELTNIHQFGKAPTAKGLWRLVTDVGL